MSTLSLFALTLATAAITWLAKFVASRYPGMRSLARWTWLASVAAGAVLAAGVGLLAACGMPAPAAAGAMACAAAALPELSGAVLLASWLPATPAATVYDEQALFRSLDALTGLLASIAGGAGFACPR